MSENSTKDRKKVAKYILICAFIFILQLIYSILRYHVFFTSAFDLGIYIRKISHYGAKRIAFLGHSEPILLLILPLYELFPYAETLLILQALSVALSGLIFYKFANEILKNRDISFGLMLLYFLNPFLLGLIRYDFHPVSLALPFIFLTAYYLEKRKYKKALIASLFILSVKEDAGIALVSLGSYYLLKSNNFSLKVTIKKGLKLRFKREEWPLIILTLLGILWILLSIFILIPHYSARRHYGYTNRYSNPLSYLPEKIAYILLHGVFVGFIPYTFPPNIFLFGVPMLENLLSSRIYQIAIGYQYQYMVVPLLFIATTYAIKIKKLDWESIKKIILTSLLISVLFSPLIPPYGIEEYFPILYKDPRFPIPSEHDRMLKNVIDIISVTNLTVLPQPTIYPHMANRKETYLFYNQTNPPDILLLDPYIPLYCIQKDDTWCYDVHYFFELFNISKKYKLYTFKGIEIYVRYDKVNSDNIQKLLAKIRQVTSKN
ncbi:DUF2079 domain-containing protein [Thermococcus barophilus]|uniref:DUF2079 domain-containing protein n=1 Tax=Thermococcus barophilus (strain DSM 11836 / MP) TaxID=391623 RepID=F0LLT8_THEBM|nr:DUF2079 domain-containing protein [Thermococcus barophilus]ADT83865.1 hypothetical protein TERMP_00888 [Thermococcus barophilus MP]